MTGMLAWVNGRRVDAQAPALSILDRGWTLADGVFETMKVVDGVVIQLDAHLARLSAGLIRLRIPMPAHLDETVADVTRLLRAARGSMALRLTVSRGVGTGVAPVEGLEPTCVVLAYPLPATTADVHERGLAVCIASGRRNERAPSAGLKTLSYTDMVLALGEARARGADDAIVLDSSDHVVEGTSSNIFVVANGDLRTPPLSCGILPGIARAAVMDLISAQEGVLVSSDLAAADEVFLTSSLRGVAPVTSIDGVPVGRGTPGPMTRRIIARYARAIADEVADNATAD
jgi:branched-chain amino acid aminotransferase